MVKKPINTTAKGDAFETRAYNIINNLLQNEQLPVNCKRSKVYCKKKYKSKLTSTDIEIDISIETVMPDSDEIAMLTLIECKDYASSISAEKIRGFQKRMEEIGAQKGYFFTTSHFQSSARLLAKANHIGLVVVDTNDNYQLIARRIAIRDKQEVVSDVINTIIGQTTERHYGFVAEGKKCYTNIYDFLHDELELPIHQTFTIKYLSDEEILKTIYNKLQLSPNEYRIITDDNLLHFISEQGYSIKSLFMTNKVLGEVDFENKEVCISDTLAEGSPRWRFTLAHELGHIILHSDSICQSEINAIEDAYDDEIPDVEISDETIKRMEIQANSFASQLLIPEDYLKVEYYCLFQEKGIRNFPYLRIDSQHCNLEMLNWFLARLALRFNVSKTAIEKRLKQMSLLTISGIYE